MKNNNSREMRIWALIYIGAIILIILSLLWAWPAAAYCNTDHYSLQNGEKVCTTCCREPSDERDMERGPTGRDLPRWRASRNCRTTCQYYPRAYSSDRYQDEDRDR